jgi:5,10-methenyltetrahydrofolate synthetase
MTPEVTAWRKQQRARLIEARQALSSIERERVAASLVANLDMLFSDLPCRILGIYWPIKAEFDLRPWANRLSEGRGIELALPVVVREQAPLEYWRWKQGDALSRGFWGIMVPAERSPVVPDAVIAPLIGHSDHYRLGFGGGYFDRTLAALSPRPFAVGVGLAGGRLDGFVPQPHDIPMSAIVTEAGITR